MAKKNNPVVFLDISIDGNSAERIEIELFADVVPRTAENFRALCTGEKDIGSSTGKPLHYKRTTFHIILKGSFAQGGDISKGDGSGGESIYGGKFSDENFKLKHDGPGILSMASSGPDTNGSQFFITFRALPHLDGKSVVFGKVSSGTNLLKRIEKSGSEKGKPACIVKVHNCGETSGDSKVQVMTKKSKGEELEESSIDLSSAGSSDDDRRLKRNRAAVKGQRKKRKRRYSSTDSSDSYSSNDSDSDSYSSYSSSNSDSGSSETSLSSDYIHKRGKKSRKDKHGHSHWKRKDPRRQRGHKKKSTRRSKRSSGSSSGSQSDHSSSSSDAKKPDKQSLQASLVLTKEAPTKPKIDDHTSTKKNASDENGGVSNRELPENVPSMEAKSDKLANQNFNADKNSSRNLKRNPDASPRGSPRRELASAPNGTHRLGAGRSSPERIPRPKASEPMLNTRQNLSQETSPDGAPNRIRKGRGFTKEYAYVRKYRSPTPDRIPVRSRRFEAERDRDRSSRYRSYTEHSAARHLLRSPRGSSPLRYQSWRGRSSTSPRSRSSRRSRSPVHDWKPARSDRLGSRLGPQVSNRDGYRKRSRSRSLDSPVSKSPGRKQREESKGDMRNHSNNSRSISPGNNGLVSYGDGSPDQ